MQVNEGLKSCVENFGIRIAVTIRCVVVLLYMYAHTSVLGHTVMDYFDAFDEVFASIEQFVQEHGRAPKEVAVSPSLYTWLAELQREAALLEGVGNHDPVSLDSPYGSIRIAIDETLSPWEIVPM